MTRVWRHVPLAVMGALALIVVPAAGESSFSAPKTTAWCALAAMLALLSWRRAEPIALDLRVGLALLNAVAWGASSLPDSAQPDAVLMQGLSAATWLVLPLH